LKVDITTEKLKRYKSPDTDQILAETWKEETTWKTNM
jgi:hypothetical protein